MVHAEYDIARCESLLHYFAALHIAYNSNKQKVAWFSQLVSFSPGIMLSLRGRSSPHLQEGPGSEMVCGSVTLCVALCIHDIV